MHGSLNLISNIGLNVHYMHSDLNKQQKKSLTSPRNTNKTLTRNMRTAVITLQILSRFST